jgi:hypothetical protein
MGSTAEPFIHRPVPAIRIGVTGSRTLQAQAIGALRLRVAAVLRQVKEQIHQLARESQAGSIYAQGPALLRLLSPLAEGSDRLVAEEAISLGYRLEVPMPFQQDEYERDFPDSLGSFRALLAQAGPRVLELDGTRGEDEGRSYEAVGRLVVRNCDLLIVIWDGEKGRGRGGTADIVRYAARHEQPIWWLHADGEADAYWLSNLHELDHRQNLRSGDAAYAALTAYLASIILPPSEPNETARGLITNALHRLRGLGPNRRVPVHPRGTQLASFLAEVPRPKRAIWKIHQKVMALAAGQTPEVSKVLDVRPPEGQVWPYWQAFYAPADRLASDYASRYRTSYVLVFTLAALAVICAALGVEFLSTALVATGLELLLLLGITGIVGVNEIRQWHGRLITYRLLAELFRKQQALALVGWSLPAAEAIHISGDADDTPTASPRDGLVGWYFNAALRAAPLPDGRLSGQMLDSAYRALHTSLIAGQAEYHARRLRESRASAHRLGQLGEVFFLATVALIVLKLAFLMIQHRAPSLHNDGMTGVIETTGFVAAVLPALSAAFVGIRGYSELELLADQSAQMRRLMSRAESRIACLALDAPLASQELGAEILTLAEGMLLDIKGWQQLFRVKAVEAG